MKILLLTCLTYAKECAPWYGLHQPQYIQRSPFCVEQSRNTCCDKTDLGAIQKKVDVATTETLNKDNGLVGLGNKCHIALHMALCAPCMGSWVRNYFLIFVV